MKVDIINNQILITKLSNAISELKNVNNFNIKRRLIESLIFEIYIKFSNYFSFSTNYKPSNKNLHLLNELMEKRLKNCLLEGEKIRIKNDIKKLSNFINEKNKLEENSTIKINNNDENGKKLYVIMEFLRFCKSLFNPSVNATDKTTLFDSKFEYKKYILNDDGIIEKNKKRINEESKQNFDINSKNKTISLQKALNIIFSLDIKELEENFENILSDKKKQLDKRIEIFK